ncbi:SMP-30/gluconolactonase/LRE family protein [Halovenus marina]|uniref:SMP-30/gluconolactonase/LRE family protein n=1 Tax=Halovenus marina TaxID=3396621 RepID=UPI003F542F58
MTTPNPDAALVELHDAEIVGSDTWLETRLDHPEDVAIGSDGTLYTGGESGQIYHVDPADNTVVELTRTNGFVLGVTLGPNGDLYGCDFQTHRVFRLPLDGHEVDGELKTVVSGSETVPPWHPNYCVFDETGRLYLSDSGDRSDMANAGGCIYVREVDGTERVLTETCSAFPNGLALSPDGTILYVAETGTHNIWTIHLDDGHAEEASVLTDEMGMIDGIAVDSSGRLYGASIGDDAIYRLEDGTVTTYAADPNGLTIGNPTNVAIDEERDVLYVANLGLNHVTALPFENGN